MNNQKHIKSTVETVLYQPKLKRYVSRLRRQS